MDSGTLTFVRPDSCIARRGSFSRGIVGDYRGSESTSTGSRTSLSPTRRNRISNGPKSPQVASSFFSEHGNTSFGDIFTAVLGSKLAKQSLPKSPQQKIEVPHLPRSKSTSAFTDKRPSTQTFLEPTKFLCRPREDRERQLDTRCLRIIRKLNCYLEYQEIVRRFACGGDEIEENGSPVSECVGKVRLRSSCGVRAYLMKYLKLKEPRQSLAVSQATLLSGDSTPDQSIAKESNGSPTRIDYRRTARNSITIDQFSEMMESFTTERPVQAVNGGSCGSTSTQTATTVTTLSPETLLRRLARSISTRLSYKRCLLENSTQRLEELKRETEVVRSVLRKVITDALPQVRSDADVFYFHIPQATSSTTPHKEMEVEMEVCQVASPINHNSHHHHQHNTLNNHNPFPDLSAATSVTSNLLPRLDRLISSQAAVLELICQLTRRLYCLDRKIAECLAKSPTPNDKKGEDAKKFNETDAVLFPLESRRQQLMEQITEAQRLRDDFEATKARLLSGLQNQFFVLRNTVTRSEAIMSCDNSSSHSEGQEFFNSSGQSSPRTPQGSEVDSVICVAEFVSRHLEKYFQEFLVKLTLETEIFDDQEAVDCVGEHLRLVSSFTP